MIIDISQEVFSCTTFPGDPVPSMERIQSIDRGDACNLTAFSMCAHNRVSQRCTAGDSVCKRKAGGSKFA